MTIKAMIFDIDGTLIDTNEAHIEAWCEAFAARHHDVPAERLRPEIGKGGDQLVPAILGPQGEEREGKALRAEHDKAYLRIAEQCHFQVFAGTAELLAEVRRRGLKVALATSSKKKFIQATQKSARFDLISLVDQLVTADEADASKPAPDLVLATLAKLNLAAEECRFVGDTVHDVEAARRSGVACLGLRCGRCSSEELLRAAGARSVWHDPADLLAHLDEALMT